MNFFLNQIADVGTRVTWTDKRFSRFLFEIRDLLDFKGEINNSWGMYSLYLHSNGRNIKEFIERLVQYGINIDSSDRTIIAYPNPFQFNIIFNGNSKNLQPVIQRKYKDIKYLKLETLTLPDYYSIKKNILPTTDFFYKAIHPYLLNNYNDVKLNQLIDFNLNSIKVINLDSIHPTLKYSIEPDKNTIYNIGPFQSTFTKSYLNSNKKINISKLTDPYYSAIIGYLFAVSPFIPTNFVLTPPSPFNISIRIVSKNIQWSVSFYLNNFEYTFTQEGFNKNPNDNLSNDDYNIINKYLINNYNLLAINNQITIPNTNFKITITSVNIYWIINYILNDDPNSVYEMDSNGSYNLYYIDPNKRLSNIDTFYVYIPELKSQNYTTSQEDVTFFVKSIGTNDYNLITNIYPTFRWYKDSSLENANKYSVKITDKYGKVFVTENLDMNANLDTCDCSNEIDYSCRCSYIRNPYYGKLQVGIQFKFGIFEDELFKPILNLHPTQG